MLLEMTKKMNWRLGDFWVVIHVLGVLYVEVVCVRLTAFKYLLVKKKENDSVT